MVICRETNEWPQIQERCSKPPPIEELLPFSGLMEKALPDQALKCPRCDSSNTKFCYYNNYSLSQPRHFCKTCKRYWTRGGTLRNVPVGGGCRKNKRMKRIGGSDHPQPPSQIEVSTSNAQPTDLNSTVHSSLFYSLANTGAGVDINLRFLRLHPPSSVAENLQASTGNSSDFLNDQLMGFSGAKQEEDQGSSYVQEQAALNPLLAEWAAATAAASSSATSFVPNISQLGSFSADRLNPNTNQINSDLSETRWKQLQQHKLDLALKPNDFPFFVPYEELQTLENGRPETVRTLGSVVKMEEENNRMNHLEWRVPCENLVENGGSDSSSLYWNAAVGAWPNATGYGSSVTPLI